MKSVKLGIFAIRDDEIVSGVIIKQQRRGDAWLNKEEIVVLSGEPGAERTLLLGNDERLIIEGASNTKVVMDPEQRAAVIRPSAAPLRKPTPPDTDGDESPMIPAPDRAMMPDQLMVAMARERQDAALTAARQKLAALQKGK